MTLKNFGNRIDFTLLQRGYNYFAAKYVENLEESERGLWLADVHGSEIYRVEVETAKTKIKNWGCNCPYDYGPICKHV